MSVKSKVRLSDDRQLAPPTFDAIFAEN